MGDDFIKMVSNIDFLCGFIYECANLINNLYDYDNYDHLVIKLCSKIVMPIINITKKEHIKEYNEHIKDIIDHLERNKDIHSICCEYLKIKEFIDNNIDIIESAFVPMHKYLIHIKNAIAIIIALAVIIRKKIRYIFPGNEHREFCEKIIKSYFNAEYIKFFYLLQKDIILNKSIYNINALIDIFMNLYDNSNTDCNKKK